MQVCGWPEDEDDKEELSRLRARPGRRTTTMHCARTDVAHTHNLALHPPIPFPGHLAAALTRCANLVEMMANGTAG